MGQRAPPRVERVLERVPCHVGQVGGVDVGEAEQAPREEARVSDRRGVDSMMVLGFLSRVHLQADHSSYFQRPVDTKTKVAI